LQKVLSELQKRVGFAVDYLTLQNEPLNPNGKMPAMYFPAFQAAVLGAHVK